MKISVIIPYYNPDNDPELERLLIMAAKSALDNLTGISEHEVIIVNDGSPSNPNLDALSGFSIKYLRRPHGMLGAARNTGMDNATGDVITFLDFRFVSHEAGETVAVFRAVETQKHKRHQVLVHHGGIEDRRVAENDAGGFQLFQPLADGWNGERSLAAQIGKRGPRVFLQLAQNVPVNIVHTVIPPFMWYI